MGRCERGGLREWGDEGVGRWRDGGMRGWEMGGWGDEGIPNGFLTDLNSYPSVRLFTLHLHYMVAAILLDSN